MKQPSTNELFDQIRDLWALCVPVDEIAKRVRLPKRLVTKAIQTGQARVLDDQPAMERTSDR